MSRTTCPGNFSPQTATSVALKSTDKNSGVKHRPTRLGSTGASSHPKSHSSRTPSSTPHTARINSSNRYNINNIMDSSRRMAAVGTRIIRQHLLNKPLLLPLLPIIMQVIVADPRRLSSLNLSLKLLPHSHLLSSHS